MIGPAEKVPENDEKSAADSTGVVHHTHPEEGERGVKRAAGLDGETLALMEELSEQMPPTGADRPTDEAPMKKSKTSEAEAMELRFELEKVKEERDSAIMKLTRSSGTEDDHAVEMEKMAEDCARTWETVELWKKRSKEIKRMQW
ncbi:unnamed protein product [Durusdinium trenchii]|uniref:Uncharacterized protein n=1 Tax=Durusdinium trenchii TaxID=1381693 RepID=A0ABP0IN10_9DINO